MTSHFTPEGEQALERRLEAIFKLWLETPAGSYPLRARMIGFPPLLLETPDQALGHIRELEQILNCKVTTQEETTQ